MVCHNLTDCHIMPKNKQKLIISYCIVFQYYIINLSYDWCIKSVYYQHLEICNV